MPQISFSAYVNVNITCAYYNTAFLLCQYLSEKKFKNFWEIGVNLFVKTFGDYPQDIDIAITYQNIQKVRGGDRGRTHRKRRQSKLNMSSKNRPSSI